MPLTESQLQELDKKYGYTAEPSTTRVDPSYVWSLKEPRYPEGLPNPREVVPSQLSPEKKALYDDWETRAKEYYGTTSSGRPATNEFKFEDDILPPLQTVSALGLITLSGLEAIRSTKELYNYVRLGNGIQKLSPQEQEQVRESIRTGNYPDWIKNLSGEQRAQAARKGEFKTGVRPVFQKLESLFKAQKPESTKETLGYLMSGPGLTKAQQQQLSVGYEKGRTPEVVQKITEAFPTVFSQQAYEKIRPHIEREWIKFNATGKNFGEFNKQVVKKYGEDAQQYVDKYKEEDPVFKLINATKRAKNIRSKQETIYTQERGKRLAQSLKVGEAVSGEMGFYKELGKFKGEIPKVDFESIRDAFSQKNIDDLFIKLKDSPSLTDWEKLSARSGLAKMFGEFGGKVPTRGELKLLEKVYGKDFKDAMLDMRSTWEKIKDAGYQLANIPRSVMSSFDLSAPFRQGVFLVGRKQFWDSFKNIFTYFGSDKAYKALEQNITSRPTYDLMKKSKLSLTELSDDLSEREEEFMSSWAEKIPIIGKGIQASERAYLGFLNKLRADVFDDMVKKAEAIGLDPKNNIDFTKSIAKYVNAATGRGSLGKLEEAAKLMNSVFFSPRLMSSRLTLLNPVYYVTQDPFVRKQAIKDLFAFMGLGTTVLALASAAGAKVEKDPRNSDFGKIKIGNTRIDIWGGFQQYIKIAAQVASGKVISSTTGKEFKLGEGYRPITRLDILARSAEYKTAPIASFGIGLIRGTNSIGEKFEVPKEVAQRFIPMVAQDFYDLYQEDPSTIPIGALGAFGFGVQTYGPKEKTKPKINFGQDVKTKPVNLKTAKLNDVK